MTDSMENKNYPKDNWYLFNNAQEVTSPALLIFPERIVYNIRKMIDIAGNANLLRPHVKTYKMSEVVRLQMNYGIHKFKCSTIAEAEMVAGCGADDILLAYQPVGPNIDRFFRLKQAFPEVDISCITDSGDIIRQLSDAAKRTGMVTNIWLDINNGMNRTGVAPGKAAEKLFQMIGDLPMLKAKGLHVYDGHIRDKEIKVRQKTCNNAFSPVSNMVENLKKKGNAPSAIVAGGTPTFPIHAGRQGVETSPGTLLLWDYGYSSSFSDLDFQYAAVLLTRVISKPGDDLICLDLGYKSIASEMPQPRIKIMDLENYTIVGHNEEHMVVQTPDASKMKIGDVLFGIPHHICPTVARYDSVTVIRDREASEHWYIEARKRKITY